MRGEVSDPAVKINLVEIPEAAHKGGNHESVPHASI